MGKRKSPLHGFPVLAYHSSNFTSPWHCRLLFKHSDKPKKQATICLQFLLHINDSIDEQSIIFQIDADNINCHNSSIHHPADIALTQERLDYIKRRIDSPDVEARTLSLSLKNTCPTWCPKSLQFTTPSSVANTPFCQLVEFTKATEVHIVLDYNRLHPQTQRPFLDRFVGGERNLTGFPVADRYSEYRLVDLDLFDADDTSANPPSYAEANKDTDVTKKRSRAVLSQTPSPSRKRVIHDESPTVCSSSMRDSSPVSCHKLEEVESQSAAIDSAVKRHLPSSLARFFTIPPCPVGPTMPLSSQRLQSPPRLTGELGRLLMLLRPTLTTVYNHAVDEAETNRDHMDSQFYESWESQMLELIQAKDDHIEEMEKRVTSLLEDLEQVLSEKQRDYEELLESMADESLDAMQKRLRMLEQFKVRRRIEEVAGKGGAVNLKGDWRARQRGKGGYRNLGARWKRTIE